MKKNLLFTIGAAMMLTISLNSCSSDGGEFFNEGEYHIYSSGESSSTDDKGFTPGDVNVLKIQSDNGNTETCELQVANCCGGGWSQTFDEDGNSHNVYRMDFSAVIPNSSLFNIMTICIESNQEIGVNDLVIGDTFDSSVIRFNA